VNDVVFIMKVVKSETELAKPRDHLGLWNLFVKISLDVLMKVTLFGKLQDQDKELFLFVHLLDLDYVGMSELKEQFGLKVEVIVG
jgi:hypothetical protein